MIVCFPADPLTPRSVDEAFGAEAEAAENHGLAAVVIDNEALMVDGDPHRAVRRVPNVGQETIALYRGWMLTIEDYAALYDALLVRNIRLISGPEQYRHTHHLPRSFDRIEAHTPKTVWIATGSEPDFDRLLATLTTFGSGPIVVKDLVKSEKHAWLDACVIPDSSDRSSVEQIVRRFIALRGPDLAGGLVFREFVDFQPIGVNPRSGMPLSNEYRRFYFDDRLIASVPCWDEAVAGDSPADEPFDRIAHNVASRFFAMDVAQRIDGRWIVMELGDGGVAGLPAATDVDAFYREIASSLRR